MASQEQNFGGASRRHLLREYCHCSAGAACTSPKRAAAWLMRCMVWLHGAAHRQLQWATLMKANSCAED